MLAAIVLLAVATIACDNKEAVEYNLQGTWHTTQPIDYETGIWQEGSTMIFNDQSQGRMYSEDNGNSLAFEWHWLDEGFNAMELVFVDGSYVYIANAIAGAFQFRGTWYNSYEDFGHERDGQDFRMDKQH